ncbi:MAG: HD-GYP domain-containing protein [Trueperaceae bacterium]|nr:HD-GYP domain-containing protein [Trueperaceae bacterium]
MPRAWPPFDPDRLDVLLARSRVLRAVDPRITVPVVAACLVAVWGLVWATGGTREPYLHAAYLPILLAAAGLGPRAAVASAAAATILLGPLMPLDVAAGTPQATSAWLFRGAFFVAIGGAAALGFEVLRARFRSTARLRQQLASTYGRSLRVFARLVEQRDAQTFGHCERVARNAVAIGRHLGMSHDALGRLYWSGLLHDLGKIGVSESILRKPGRLDAAEMDEVKLHCAIGRDVLLDVSEHFAPIAEGLLSHHERYDGWGYPRGLAGAQIPRFGRILAVADVYEALTSDRPYRGPMTRSDALQILDEGRGTHFDPSVHDAFLEALSAGEIQHEQDGGPDAERFVEALAASAEIGENLLSHDRAPPAAA